MILSPCGERLIDNVTSSLIKFDQGVHLGTQQVCRITSFLIVLKARLDMMEDDFIPPNLFSAMAIRQFKRFRMEIDLQTANIGRARLPEGYRWRKWSRDTIHDHATVKFLSFQRELDRHLFPSFASLPGCTGLMTGISSHPGFLHQATWLIEYDGNAGPPSICCGTIQGLATNSTSGAIQNVGVIPEHRGFGLGRALVVKSLQGFRSTGRFRIGLEVTAYNIPAYELYRSIGFECIGTSYRQVNEPAEESL